MKRMTAHCMNYYSDDKFQTEIILLINCLILNYKKQKDNILQ
jgi:hypothetical protein